jgi:hypothetical protein
MTLPDELNALDLSTEPEPITQRRTASLYSAWELEANAFSSSGRVDWARVLRVGVDAPEVGADMLFPLSEVAGSVDRAWADHPEADGELVLGVGAGRGGGGRIGWGVSDAIRGATSLSPSDGVRYSSSDSSSAASSSSHAEYKLAVRLWDRMRSIWRHPRGSVRWRKRTSRSRCRRLQLLI